MSLRPAKYTETSARWLYVGAALVVLVLLGFGVLVWQAGFFDFSGTESSAKIVAAALALSGALIGSLASIVAMLFKHSVDIRNAGLKAESESRLRLSAAIQAVGLLSTADGKPVPRIQRAGALFALVGLERYELATFLAGELLANSEIDASSASAILNRVLLRAGESTQRDATTMLLVHTDKFLKDDGGAAFPNCIATWKGGFSDYVGYWSMIALGGLLVARPHDEWNHNQVRTIFGALVLAWEGEKNEEIKNEMGAVLRGLLVERFPGIPEVHHPMKTLNVDEVRQAVASLSAVRSSTKALLEKITAWVPAD